MGTDHECLAHNSIVYGRTRHAVATHAVQTRRVPPLFLFNGIESDIFFLARTRRTKRGSFANADQDCPEKVRAPSARVRDNQEESVHRLSKTPGDKSKINEKRKPRPGSHETRGYTWPFSNLRSLQRTVSDGFREKINSKVQRKISL